MQSWRLEAFDLKRLVLAETPDPVAGPGEVLVEIAAVSLNYRDLAIAAGAYAPSQRLPMTPASDAVGTITALGPGVSAWNVGDRVIGCYMQSWDRGASTPRDRGSTLGSPLEGVLCERRAFPADAIVAAPAGLTDEECATLPVAGVTAWCALFERGEARAGEIVLVQGSGGVSTFAIQIAAAAGLHVVAVSRSSEKLKIAQALGASVIVDTSSDGEWGKAVLQATGGAGADVILDVGGAGTLRQSMRSAAQNGRVVTIGYLGGLAPDFELGAVITKNLTLRGITVGSKHSFEDFLRFLERTRIKPVIDSVYTFKDATHAFARLASGEQQGKICIRVGATS